MIKVPCGGFELGDSLVVNDGKLDLAPGAGGGVTVDSELSDTSTNPVQNKVIKSALDAKSDVYAVTITMNGVTGETSADKTFDEIKTAYSSGMFMFAKYVVSYEDMNLIRGVSATCNYRPSDNTIIFTFGFGEGVSKGIRSVTIGSISIDSNNNIAIEDRGSMISGLISDSIILSSKTPGSTKRFEITVDDSGAISAKEATI